MSKTELPEGFPISPELRGWAELRVPQVDIEREHETFCDYWHGNGKRMKSWPAVWRNWMRRAPKFGGAMRPPDEVYIITLMRQYEPLGFRRAHIQESSFMYTQAFEAWRDRNLPMRNVSSLVGRLKNNG